MNDVREAWKSFGGSRDVLPMVCDKNGELIGELVKAAEAVVEECRRNSRASLLDVARLSAALAAVRIQPKPDAK